MSMDSRADRQARVEAMRGVREVRLVAAAAEVREATSGGLVNFRGLASRTAHSYDMGSYQEQIARGAFAETLKRTPDVNLLVNHEGLPLARTTIPAGQPGHLALTEDQDGLQFEAQCDPNDPDVARLASKIRSGLMDQCSFAFRVTRQNWQWMEDTGKDYDQRIIQEVSLDRGDVSVCNYGANPATPVAVRAYLAGLDDAELAEYRLARIARDGGDMPGNPGCGCCPDCQGSQQNAAPELDEAIAPVHDLDYYRARAYTLGLPRH